MKPILSFIAGMSVVFGTTYAVVYQVPPFKAKSTTIKNIATVLDQGSFVVLGLGGDQKIYFWDSHVPDWRLYVTKEATSSPGTPGGLVP